MSPEMDNVFARTQMAANAVSSTSAFEEGPCLSPWLEGRRTIGVGAAQPRTRMNTHTGSHREEHRTRPNLHTHYPQASPTAAPTTIKMQAEEETVQQRHDMEM
jgi:hypothetical protein